MIFASPVFLFLFLPAFLALYYLSPQRWRSAAILAGSSVFYAWWRADFLLLLYAIILWNWIIALVIEKHRQLWVLQAGIAVNLATLGYFKYWNFGVNSFFAIFMKAGSKPPPELADVLLPIGISFFVSTASAISSMSGGATRPPREIYSILPPSSRFSPILSRAPCCGTRTLPGSSTTAATPWPRFRRARCGS